MKLMSILVHIYNKIMNYEDEFLLCIKYQQTFLGHRRYKPGNIQTSMFYQSWHKVLIVFYLLLNFKNFRKIKAVMQVYKKWESWKGSRKWGKKKNKSLKKKRIGKIMRVSENVLH